jgi:hypothetical protein
MRADVDPPEHAQTTSADAIIATRRRRPRTSTPLQRDRDPDDLGLTPVWETPR